MRHLLSSLLLGGFVLGAMPLPYLSESQFLVPTAQASQSDVYYTFYGQRIPLSLRQDRIAVLLSPPVSGTRGGAAAYQQLEQALSGRSGSRGGTSAPALAVTLRPLGSRYAIIELPSLDGELRAAVEDRLQQPYIEATLPVLSRTGSDDTIVLPNQIIVSFEPDTPQSQVQLTLSRYGLEMIRPLQFSQNRYLVSAREGDGLRVLNIANQLNGVVGIQSATPNFVQTVPYHAVPQSLDRSAASAPSTSLDNLLARLTGPKAWPVATDLFPLHWHLDSVAFRGSQQPRTDIQAVQAWQQGTQGEGVVVAVIDSLIQWDHPDLANSLYTVPETQLNRLPDEVHGWDFSNQAQTCEGDRCAMGDPDTRISTAELDLLRPHLQNTFLLSDAELLVQYPSLTETIQTSRPEFSQHQVAGIIRDQIRGDVMAEFHGTWSSGVIAASPATARGVVGVAPKAQILPVRVFGLGGEITMAALVEAVGYAADRGADVINLSLGGLLPDRELTDQIMSVLDTHPNLVIVASAGNDSLDGVGFPAAIPGVLSVGAITMEGRRTFYSSYGSGLDVVAPGGDISQVGLFGILTTGGTGVTGFWRGMEPPTTPWGMGLDGPGQFVQVQGTSFSAPVASGTVALMLAANSNLSRDQVTEILTATASYTGLGLTQSEINQYRLQAEVGLGTAVDNQVLRPSGIFSFPQPVSSEQYYFGRGLVNAAAAVEQAKALR